MELQGLPLGSLRAMEEQQDRLSSVPRSEEQRTWADFARPPWGAPEHGRMELQGLPLPSLRAVEEQQGRTWAGFA